MKPAENNDIKIDIVIPAYNEERILEKNITRLIAFLKAGFTYKNFKVIIADNGSVDNTFGIAQRLAKRYGEVTCLHLSKKGRGGALRKAWLESDADIVSYMDADLSADLEALPELINSITTGGYDIAVGSRLLPASRTNRSRLRRFLSYAYNLVIKDIFCLEQLPDAQCGFKALRKTVIDKIVPKIRNQNWFFDSELLIHGVKKGYKIKYLPVNWEERLKTKVKIWKTIFEDIFGILRLILKQNEI